MTLTASQERAFQQITESAAKKRWHVLKGYAGTGKTYLCDTLAKNYAKVTFCAPTNKAVKVMRQATGCPAETVYKLLCLRINERGFLEQYAQPSFGDSNLLVVDEASMVSTKILVLLKKYVPAHLPVLFVGDPYQLPPVRETESPVFKLVPNHSELTEIVRQAEGNPIIELSMRIREGRFDPRNIAFDGKALANMIPHTQTTAETIQFINQMYERSQSPYLGYTNSQVNRINHGVHALRYPGCDTDFAVGEEIVLAAPFINVFSPETEVLADNGDVFTVTKIEKTKMPFADYYPWEMTVTDGTVEHVMLVLTPDDRRKVNATIEKLREEKEWAQAQNMSNLFVDVRHTYAYTTHKSQGSTFDHSAIGVNDIFSCRDKSILNKLLYVAVTRARKGVAFVT